MIGVILLEFEQVFDLGTAPAINGLIVVTDDKQVVAVAGQQGQPSILDAVGVLEFVHQHMAEAALVMG